MTFAGLNPLAWLSDHCHEVENSSACKSLSVMESERCFVLVDELNLHLVSIIVRP
jgi:hypothetical protein